MTVGNFLEFVELRTKVASVLPFLVGAAYVLEETGKLMPSRTILFFISMFCIDLATTAINNYLDEHRHVRHGLPVILFLLVVAGISGLGLVYLAGWPVLLIGLVAFMVGITYTFGPRPINRTPFGELASGTMMGGLIVYAFYYIQVDKVTAIGSLKVIAVSVPLVLMIAGIMLANNLCDLERDRQERRFTLPHYLGIGVSLRLFEGLYIGSYVLIGGMTALGILPWTCLTVLLTVPRVWHNIRTFRVKQDKRTTFVLSVKNFLWVGGIYASSIYLDFFAGLLTHK